MTRYFMLVSEAVELVIQAGSIGSGGEVFILDMGEPVRIADMARDLIRLMGKEPGRDIEIVYTGPRPGEKIHEELLISRQDVRTPFEDIWIDGEPCPSVSWTELAAALRSLFEAARRGAEDEVVERLKGLVPEFQPAYARTGGALKEDRSVDARMAETVRRARTLERRRAARHLATGVEAVPS
jgi:FlaA1/EpsC-like NDP-sugar epimerase